MNNICEVIIPVLRLLFEGNGYYIEHLYPRVYACMTVLLKITIYVNILVLMCLEYDISFN